MDISFQLLSHKILPAVIYLPELISCASLFTMLELFQGSDIM
jgi:hypothetical protein